MAASQMCGLLMPTRAAGSRWRPPRRCSPRRGTTTGRQSLAAGCSSSGVASVRFLGCSSAHGHTTAAQQPQFQQRWITLRAGTVEEASRPIGDRWCAPAGRKAPHPCMAACCPVQPRQGRTLHARCLAPLSTLCRLFDLQQRQWRQLPVRGIAPLPRFLFGFAQYTPAGGGADRFVMFGGRTGALRGADGASTTWEWAEG